MHSKFKKRFDEIETFRNQLLQSLKDTPETILMKSPGPGRWSAIQAIQHLVVAETGTNKYLKKKIQGKDKVPFSGLGNGLRMGLGKLVLSLPIKYKAPDVVANPPDNMGLQETITMWDATRKEFKAIVEDLESKDLKRELFKHPFMGRLDIFQTMDFFDFHARRHAIQAKKTIKEVGGK